MVAIKLTDVLSKGKTYQHRVTTGDRFFTSVYARQYAMTIMAIDNESIGVHLRSVDYVPSGYQYGGSDKDFGIHVFRYTDQDDINDTGKQLWTTILTKIDPTFVQHMENNNA